MLLGTILLWVALAGLLVGLVHFYGMISFLLNRGVRINWFLIKVLMPSYVHRYKRITQEESGRPGPLFYGFVVGMNTALVSGILGMVLR